MGCDIHLHLERLDHAKGEWVWVEPPEIELFDDYKIRDWYSGRNYELFAALADVRNRADITPISDPRGLPQDVTSESRRESDEYGIDGHSHSWLTLRELRSLDGTKIPHTGLIHDRYPDGRRGRAQDIADHANATGKFPWDWPGASGYCQGIYGPTADEYERVEWTQDAEDAFGSDWSAFLEAAGRYTLDDGNDVRAVFWFDN